MIIPKSVLEIIEKLTKAGFEAFVVGGSVRDFLLEQTLPTGRKAKDWDITTNATPEEIQKVFPKSFYENEFLTVTVQTGDTLIPEVQVTTYRSEAKYSDYRHPDVVKFAKTLTEDLSRRDFTVNAMALEITNYKSQTINIIDLFGGQEDLQRKLIRAVGDPNIRFAEDALRMLRAVRFATTLHFSIEEKTLKAIQQHAPLMKEISQERIRDEFVKIIMSDRAMEGIELLRTLGILPFIMPELQENYGVGQNKHHVYDCYMHAIKALEYTVKKGYDVNVRLAALLHDIGKPRVKVGDGIDSTFYNHEVVGAHMATAILHRLKFPRKQVEKITKLVRYHLFYYNVDEVTESSVRRLIRNVGQENIYDLLKVREADRIGSGVPKAEPYKLRHLKYIIDKVSQDPISVKMLKINGREIMQLLGIHPGPKVGKLLDALLGIVLEDPQKNTKEFLEHEVKRLDGLTSEELEVSARKGRENQEEIQEEHDKAMKKKYWVG